MLFRSRVKSLQLDSPNLLVDFSITKVAHLQFLCVQVCLAPRNGDMSREDSGGFERRGNCLIPGDFALMLILVILDQLSPVLAIGVRQGNWFGRVCVAELGCVAEKEAFIMFALHVIQGDADVAEIPTWLAPARFARTLRATANSSGWTRCRSAATWNKRLNFFHVPKLELFAIVPRGQECP